MPTIIPNQKVIDIALFMQYLQQLKKMPRTANSLFSRITSVYEKLKIMNNVEIASPEWQLPYEEKELYLPISSGILNGDLVTREWDGTSHYYIRNGVNETDVVTELVATYPNLKPHFSNIHRNELLFGNAFVHPDGVVLRLVGWDSTAPAYAKGLLIQMDTDLVIGDIIETWTESNHQKQQNDPFMNTIAVMSIEGASMWCINLDTSKNSNVLSTMEYNLTDKTAKYYNQIKWTYDAVTYELLNGFLMRGSQRQYVGFDPTEICNRLVARPGNASVYAKTYLGYPFQMGFDGTYFYWNTSKRITPIYYTPNPTYYASYQYVKRFKVVE